MFRTWNMKFSEFVATELSPGLSKVHYRCLYEFSSRCWYSKWIKLKRNFFENGRKNFDLFVKTAFYVSKGTLWVKKQLLKFLILFSNSSVFWTNIYRAWRTTFRQGYQNWKLKSSCHKINQKTKLLKSLFFFKLFGTLNEHLLCLARKFLAGLSKLKIAVFVSKDQ